MGAHRLILGLGNPGSGYSTTRHNVGWWLLDRLTEAWSFGNFRGRGKAAVAEGSVLDTPVKLVKPLTYMNRSGDVLGPLKGKDAFDGARDLLVLVDDVALAPGRARFRAAGSAGGHNGLKSVEASLGTREYNRLRIGVGSAPPGADLARWVLSSPSPSDRKAIQEIFPDLIEGIELWMTEGNEAAMRRCNR